jgi:hypothetical protein
MVDMAHNPDVDIGDCHIMQMKSNLLILSIFRTPIP